MKLTELTKILKATGFPVAYSHFKTHQEPPFVVYVTSHSSNFIADGKVYKKITNVQIELYTSKKDLDAEAKVEQVLDDNNITYQSTETFIETENLFQIVYEIKI